MPDTWWAGMYGKPREGGGCGPSTSRHEEFLGSGRVCSGLVGSGRVWSGLFGFGRVWSAGGGYCRVKKKNK